MINNKITFIRNRIREFNNEINENLIDMINLLNSYSGERVIKENEDLINLKRSQLQEKFTSSLYIKVGITSIDFSEGHLGNKEIEDISYCLDQLRRDLITLSDLRINISWINKNPRATFFTLTIIRLIIELDVNHPNECHSKKDKLKNRTRTYTLGLGFSSRRKYFKLPFLSQLLTLNENNENTDEIITNAFIKYQTSSREDESWLFETISSIKESYDKVRLKIPGDWDITTSSNYELSSWVYNNLKSSLNIHHYAEPDRDHINTFIQNYLDIIVFLNKFEDRDKELKNIKSKFSRKKIAFETKNIPDFSIELTEDHYKKLKTMSNGKPIKTTIRKIIDKAWHDFNQNRAILNDDDIE
ncbi:hypothetical protein LO872_001863 [Vibrio fluvialis]|nr:hypothetical protein [Vibrio fluvialis]